MTQQHDNIIPWISCENPSSLRFSSFDILRHVNDGESSVYSPSDWSSVGRFLGNLLRRQQTTPTQRTSTRTNAPTAGATTLTMPPVLLKLDNNTRPATPMVFSWTRRNSFNPYFRTEKPKFQRIASRTRVTTFTLQMPPV